ncbi:MAG TPA: hypothetical protein PKC43_02780 [Phycisphaerales bacterium]|nr:hypothetical protein [Phycisphaerales bacterium]HMP36351.1 hypothetical protein [Phycisphaerales bacterium]
MSEHTERQGIRRLFSDAPAKRGPRRDDGFPRAAADRARGALLALLLALGPCGAAMHAQSTVAVPGLGADEVAEIRREYAAAGEAERAALRAWLADMGFDVATLLAGAETEGAAPAAKGDSPLLQIIRNTEFVRTPAAVLAARSQLGFESPAAPAPEDHAAVAKWLHLQVMAGEWAIFAEYLRSLPRNDAVGIFSHVLQGLNSPPRNNPGARPDPALLPEEVLAIADASPIDLPDWQVDTLAGLIRNAATRYSTAPMLAKIHEGTRSFGRADADQRQRTVRLLVAAGLVRDAYAYLPSLDDVRGARDGAGLLNHARYHEELASHPATTTDRDGLIRTAWDLYAELTLMPEAEPTARTAALRKAIDLLPGIPPGPAGAWLREVFASQSLAPAALEVIALKAVGLRDSRLGTTERAQTILTMKESVDTLLARTGVELHVIRVPLRMLTNALVAEAETALDGGQQQQQQFPPYMMQGRRQSGGDTRLLGRALPDERWLAALDPSLVSRVYNAAIGIAIVNDEIDAALEYLARASSRFPDQAIEFADRFLRRWETRLVSTPQQDEDWFFWGWGYNRMPSAPLTRGRQRRNLERLTRLMDVMDSIGVESRQLPSVAAAFRRCHGATEIFTREGIEAVFGPIEELSPRTAAALAEQMRSGLGADWRDRRAQQQAGSRRTPAELAAMVEQGYALALILIERAIAGEPASWRHAVTKAGLAFDRVQYKQAQEGSDFTTYNRYRKEAFEAFAQTAERYADLVRAGEQRDDAGVYLAWFNAAIGGSELNYLTRDDLLVEGSPQDDQIDLIRKAIEALPPDAADRHIALFAQAVDGALGGLPPEIKPRIVRHAMRIVGDHDGGAGLRRLADLYQDLVKDEIKLRVVIDGDDRVGARQPFGATILMRFTAAVDRETGGFSRYLQNDVWTRVGSTMRSVNYRDQLRKDLETALAQRFDVEGLAFFEALAPPLPVREAGEDGWLEKPVAYALLAARDPSADRLPSVSMDLTFNDMLGVVTLPVVSNAQPIDAASEPSRRPLRNLEVTQTLDLRQLAEGERNPKVTLEIHAKGEGVIPELDALLPGYATALPGFAVAEGGVERRPLVVMEADAVVASSQMFGRRGRETAQDYIKPDDRGAYRLPTERSWLITYTPAGGAAGKTFTLPKLAEGVEGSLVSRQYADMDVVEIAGTSVAVAAPGARARTLLFAVIIAALIAVAVFVLRRQVGRAAPMEAGFALPERITPLSVVTALRRIERDGAVRLGPDDRRSLAEEIDSLQQRYFGPAADRTEGAIDRDDLRSVLERWLGHAGGVGGMGRGMA